MFGPAGPGVARPTPCCACCTTLRDGARGGQGTVIAAIRRTRRDAARCSRRATPAGAGSCWTPGTHVLDADAAAPQLSWCGPHDVVEPEVDRRAPRPARSRSSAAARSGHVPARWRLPSSSAPRSAPSTSPSTPARSSSAVRSAPSRPCATCRLAATDRRRGGGRAPPWRCDGPASQVRRRTRPSPAGTACACQRVPQSLRRDRVHRDTSTTTSTAAHVARRCRSSAELTHELGTWVRTRGRPAYAEAVLHAGAMNLHAATVDRRTIPGCRPTVERQAAGRGRRRHP